MKALIQYFTEKHLLGNVLFFGTILLAIFSWFDIGKEEMPEFASNWVRINTVYPGAPAEDVELFVTKPIEDELKGVIGLEEVASTSSVGVSSFRIVIDDDYPDKDEVVQEIKDAVFRVNLPSEVRNIPNIRQFKSSEKAILDIGLYHKDHEFLDQKARAELQKYVLGFENQLLSLKEVSSIDRSSYLKPELQVLVDPEKAKKAQISLSEVKRQIQDNNVRVPIGSMQDRNESKVTALNEYETVDSFSNLILRGNYEGQGIKLGEIATVQEGHERNTSIFKINGHEGVFLNVKKSISSDILSAQAAVLKFIDNFNRTNKDSPIGIVLMDDESKDVTNRLAIISSNGILGFLLIIIVLYIFMDFKTSFWVAMGIPFSMAFTVIIANIMGYTVNNMTLAGIIIVLGIVVDDAIIVSENISRLKDQGFDSIKASVVGTYEVFKPILASIITTCVAFVPLMFFEGFFGKLVAYIPLIVILMLIGSLVESLIILPSHLSSKSFFFKDKKTAKRNWFYHYEEKYESLLLKLLDHRLVIFGVFTAILLSAGYFYNKNMKFVMFPREESEEVIIKVKAKKETLRQETAKLISPIERMFVEDKENVVGVRSSIAKSRRGGEVNENEASILVELKSADKRKVPLKKLLEGWEAKTKDLPGLTSVKFIKGRWGHDSGSAIEIQVLENNDKSRSDISKEIAEKMKGLSYLSEVEIEEPLTKKEYLFKIKQEKLIKLNVSPERITTALRSYVEGSILYSINKGEEEIDVRLSVPDDDKKDLNQLLTLEVENSAGHLIALSEFVDIQEENRPVNIARSDYKRSTMIYADLKTGTKVTPLQVAEQLEADIFPAIHNKFPTAILGFKGEIEDTRESQGEFLNSIIIVIISIYLILIVMFNSLTKPLLVMTIVPFGLSGVIYVLLLHGMSIYGFFAAIGALGMIGVVINDAIVMIDKIEKKVEDASLTVKESIAKVASTRLKPILLTTITTVAGVLPTAYGIAGYDSMLSEMMLTMGWGLLFGTVITLILIPCLYSYLPTKSKSL